MTALALAKRNMSVGVNMTQWHMNERVDSWHGQFAGHETNSSSEIPLGHGRKCNGVGTQPMIEQ
jgi:hypothetical protein